MFVKVYEQILDSSIAEDWQTRHVFEDLLKLADWEGIVDMTREAIARRTNVPLEVINHAITSLEAPDPSSRTPTEDGRRIVRVAVNRDWGWRIVNYEHYRNMRDDDARKKYMRRYMRNYRKPKDLTVNSVNTGKLPLAHTDTDTDTDKSTPPPPFGGDGKSSGKEGGKPKPKRRRASDRQPRVPTNPLALRIGRMVRRMDTTAWSGREQAAFSKVVKMKTSEDDMKLMEEFYAFPHQNGNDFRRREVLTLLNNWPGEVDKARRWKNHPESFVSHHNTVSPVKKREALESLIAVHPCNEKSTHHTGNESKEKWAEFNKLRSDLNAVTRLIANGGTT